MIRNADNAGTNIVYSYDPADLFYMGINVPCQNACPAFTNVPAYIRQLFESKYDDCFDINQAANVFPGVLGRVCSRPCEDKCRHGEPELGRAVNICHIKRAGADYKNSVDLTILPDTSGKKVCIVGSGPAGLAAAHDLCLAGIDVTVLEQFDKAGGMLRYGIPEFRLPRKVLDEEIASIFDLGVRFRPNTRVGRDVPMEELLAFYDAVVLAAGCYVSRPLDIPGEDLPGVITGLNFVLDQSSKKTVQIGKKVLVIGAGFTAFDCARLALRMGAEDVSICVRGTEEYLRVTADEVHEAKREGVKILGLMVSDRIIGEDRVEGVEFVRSRLGGFRPNGRREIETIKGSEFVVSCDNVIVAVGQGAEAIESPGERDRRGVVKGDPETFLTSVPHLYVIGDFMTGPSTVIQAIASGRRAARRITEDLGIEKTLKMAVRIQDAEMTDRQRPWDHIQRNEMPAVLPVSDRFHPPNKEVELGYSRDQAFEESKRCYLCYLHYEIDITKCIYCRNCIDSAPRDCIKMVQEIITNELGAVTGFVETTTWRHVNAITIDNSRCIRCGECVRVCPVDCISVSKVELVERTAQAE